MLKIRAVACRTPALILTIATVSMVLTSCGGVGQTSNVVNYTLPAQTPPNVVNTMTVTVGVTWPGQGGSPTGYGNGVFTSVGVCRPAVLPVGQNPPGGPPLPATCQIIPNILVDTGSVGLRLLESATVDDLNLPSVTDSNNNPLQECVQFADLSYVWGPVARATIEMADENATQVPLPGETANTGIPVQIITLPQYQTIAVPADCLASPPSGGVPIAANTLQTLGANGILGVGSFPQDCGAACTSTPPRNQYYSCPSNLCTPYSIPQNLQVWNPVAAFAYDNDGISLTLPSAPLGGVGCPPPNAAEPPNSECALTGTLTFGIETQSNNNLSQPVEVYGLDAYGNFPQVTFTYPNQIDSSQPPILLVNYLSPQDGSYIDSGSPAIYFSDAQSLLASLPTAQSAFAVPECLNPNVTPPSIYSGPLGLFSPSILYCPTTPINFTAKVYGSNHSVPGLINWYIENAKSLLNSQNSVFSTLGGDSGINVSTDYVDLGLPFFLGQTVFVGYAGTTLPYPQPLSPTTYPNGFWAF